MIILYLSKPFWQMWTKTKLCIVIKNKSISISNSYINYNNNTNCDNCWNVIFCLYQTDKQTKKIHTPTHSHTQNIYIHTHTQTNTHTNVVSSASESRRKEKKFLTLKYFFPSLSHKWRRGDGSPSSPNPLHSVQF